MKARDLGSKDVRMCRWWEWTACKELFRPATGPGG